MNPGDILDQSCRSCGSQRISRAPRFDEAGNKTENARISAWLNGRKIHEDVEVAGRTTAGWREGDFAEGPLMLQDHGNPVRFRNVWILPR